MFLLAQRDRLRYLLLVASRVLVQALDLMGLVAVGLIGTTLASRVQPGSNLVFMGLELDVTTPDELLGLVGITVAFFLSKSAISSFLLRVTTRFVAQVEGQAALEVTRYLFSGGLARLKSFPNSEQVWLSLYSTSAGFSVLFSVATIISEGALFLVVFMAFLLVDASTAGVIATYFVVLALIFQVSVNRRLKRLGNELANTAVDTNDDVISLSGAFREIVVGNNLEFFLEKFAKNRLSYSLATGTQRFVMGLPRFIVEAGLMVGLLLLVLWQFIDGSLEDGLVVTAVFLSGGVRMMASLLPMQNALTDLRIRASEADRAFEVLMAARAERRWLETNGTLADFPDRRGPHSVEFRGVSFSYSDSDSETISNISFSINPGEFVAIIGPSGAGKTTVADLILGLVAPRSGEVLVSDMPPAVSRVREPGRMAYVPQKPGLVSGTLAENVAVGFRHEDIDLSEVERALRLSHLYDSILELPDGLETSISASGLNPLSGGQVQRLGIARAIYSKPDLIVLDEATSALDAETEHLVSEALRSVSGVATIVVIAHRLSTVQHARKVLVIEEGKLVAQGSFQNVRRQVPMVEQYVQLMKISDQ